MIQSEFFKILSQKQKPQAWSSGREASTDQKRKRNESKCRSSIMLYMAWVIMNSVRRSIACDDINISKILDPGGTVPCGVSEYVTMGSVPANSRSTAVVNALRLVLNIGASVRPRGDG